MEKQMPKSKPKSSKDLAPSSGSKTRKTTFSPSNTGNTETLKENL